MTAVDVDALEAARAAATGATSRRLSDAERARRKRNRLITRLMESSEVDPETGCRRWTGRHYPKGYGRIKFDNKYRAVHIVAHKLWVGPIPEGYDVDHVAARGCRYRDCFEPLHLEAVTHAENVRRAADQRTHCRNGHEYLPETTGVRSDSPSRRCLICRRQRDRAYRSRVPAEPRTRRVEANR